MVIGFIYELPLKIINIQKFCICFKNMVNKLILLAVGSN